jgi:hypothetical protein
MVGAPEVVRAQAAAVAAHDDEVRCVTTTAEAPWQVQALAKPGWQWDAVGFVNPDGGLVMLLRNAAEHEQFVDIRAGMTMVTVKLLSDSISTVTMKA